MLDFGEDEVVEEKKVFKAVKQPKKNLHLKYADTIENPIVVEEPKEVEIEIEEPENKEMSKRELKEKRKQE